VVRPLLAFVLLSSSIAHAGQATCSNPGLPLGAASRELFPGRLTLNLTTGILPIQSEEVLQEAQGPVLYDTRLVLLETRLAAEYAWSPYFAFALSAPYRVVDVDVTHRDPATGEPIAPPTSIHSRTERIDGIGDLQAFVRYARDLGAFRLFVRGGTSIPLGSTEEDPHLLGSIGQEHQHIQLGTGTFIPLVAAEIQRAITPRITAGMWTLAQLSLYDNDQGFRAGDRISAGVYGASGFGLKTLTFNAGLEGHGETAETWQGVVYEDEGNAGRFDLMVGGGVAWRPMRNFAVVADVRVPVYSHVVGPQLDYGVVAGFGVVGTFDLKRRPTYRGLDEKPIAAPGTAADLVPVPGKITVFDLWAEWCPPCRELDDRLVALASRSGSSTSSIRRAPRGSATSRPARSSCRTSRSTAPTAHSCSSARHRPPSSCGRSNSSCAKGELAPIGAGSSGRRCCPCPRCRACRPRGRGRRDA
jgi:thiol-disulfide isomerase/thioredoxin